MIERACERLVLDFAALSDQQQYDGFAGVFAAEATLTRPSGETLEGIDAIIRSYTVRVSGRSTRHICTNIRITVDDADNAHGSTYALVYSAECGQDSDGNFGVKADSRQLIGEFEDVFVRTDAGWRIRRRLARFVMHS